MSILTEKIQNIVVLMLENRSLDHVLGCLYDEVKDPPKHNIPATGTAAYDGVLRNGAIRKECANTYTYYGSTKKTVRPIWSTTATSTGSDS